MSDDPGRELWLLRHTKSDWSDPALADHDRPLAERGRRAGPLMGTWMRRRALAFDLVVCSTARRARQTLELADPPLAGGGLVTDDSRVYDATSSTLAALVRSLPERAARVLVVGHNPSLQDLAVFLAADPADRERLARRFPTGALAGFQVAPAWDRLAGESNDLLDFVVPRDLG